MMGMPKASQGRKVDGALSTMGSRPGSVGSLGSGSRNPLGLELGSAEGLDPVDGCEDSAALGLALSLAPSLAFGLAFSAGRAVNQFARNLIGVSVSHVADGCLGAR